MRHIMVMNAKGGCGKSTLATNLASYYADAGYAVALADYDPQRSGLDWLDRRPDNRAEIVGIAGFEDGLKGFPGLAPQPGGLGAQDRGALPQHSDPRPRGLRKMPPAKARRTTLVGGL